MKARMYLLLGSMAIALLCAEVALRFLSIRHGRFVPHAIAGHANTPNSDFLFAGMQVCTGDDGCIRATREPAGELDLLVVGDSFAAGQSAPWGEGCIEVLSDRLQATTINLGTAGYGTDQCLLRLREYLSRQPKLVLYLLCFNDLRDNIEFNQHGLYRPRFALVDGALTQTDWPRFQNSLLLNSALCGVIHRQLFSQVLQPLEKSQDSPAARAELAAKLIEQMESESKAVGARFVVVSHWMATDAAPQEDFALLMERLRNRGTELLVLNEVATLGKHYDPARWHWNAQGHKLAGEKIAEFVVADRSYETPLPSSPLNMAQKPAHATRAVEPTLQR